MEKTTWIALFTVCLAIALVFIIGFLMVASENIKLREEAKSECRVHNAALELINAYADLSKSCYPREDFLKFEVINCGEKNR